MSQEFVTLADGTKCRVVRCLMLDDNTIVAPLAEPEAAAPVEAAPVARKGRKGKRGPRPQKPGESDIQYAARVERYNEKHGLTEPAPVATAASAPAKSEKKSSEKKGGMQFHPLCEAAGLAKYNGPSGTKMFAIVTGTTRGRDWKSYRSISKNGFYFGKGFFPNPEKIVKETMDHKVLTQVCGCEKCKAAR